MTKSLNTYKSALMLLFFLPMELQSADYVYNSNSGLQFAWKTDDAVGVTTGSAEQLKFWVSSTPGQNSTERSLYAVGYLLKPNMTYYSYSPFVWKEHFDATNIACSYGSQVQKGNSNTEALAKYDFQMATAHTSESACTFTYKHIGSVIRLSFLAPEAMNVTKVSLVADKAVIATAATMNIVSQSVTLGERSSSVSLTTDNMQVSKGAQGVAYIMLPAQDLSAADLDIVVEDGKGMQTTLAKVKGPNLKAGRMYEMSLLNVASRTSKNAKSNAKGATIRMASGIANPLAKSSHITIDNDYTVELISNTMKGDVNNDGVVDVLDPAALAQYCVKDKTSQLSKAVCDMNTDGRIDVLDVALIIDTLPKDNHPGGNDAE